MLNFTGITSTGYIIVAEDGTTKAITANYNNRTRTAHILHYNHAVYEVNPNFFLVRRDTVCQYVRVTPAAVWEVAHNFNSSVLAHVLQPQSNNLIYPKKIILVNSNQQQIVFEQAMLGTVVIRAT